MIRKYHNHKLQTNPWHREEEPHNNHETPTRQTKQSSLFPIKMIANLNGQLQTPTMRVTINNESTTTETPP